MKGQKLSAVNRKALAEKGVAMTDVPVVETRRGSVYLEPDPPASTPRGAVLLNAKALIEGDRQAKYGPPTVNFARISGILQALGYRAPGPNGPGTADLRKHDAAVMAKALKLSRIVESPEERDHWVDDAGYSGCGWECVLEETREN